MPIIFAVTLHEAAHGYVAHRLGDNTAYLAGRITPNPFKHIDIVGTILVPLVLMVSTKGSIIFGWAKPVPVNGAQLRNPKRDFAIVALAGPCSNGLMAIFWVLMLKISIVLVNHKFSPGIPLLYMCQAGVMINLVLMVLNLIPIPPLDGSRFLSYLLPAPLDGWYNRLEPIWIMLIIALIFSGILTSIITTPVVIIYKFLLGLLHIQLT